MSDLNDLKETMNSLGPKRVKTKDFEAEQFDPEKILSVMNRQSSHPTFNNMTKVQVVSNRAAQDCGGCDETS